MSYSGIITSMVVQEHPWTRALCEPLGPDGLISLLWRLLKSNQAGMCPIPLPQPALRGMECSGHVSSSTRTTCTSPNQRVAVTCLPACPGLFVQHTALTFHQYFGDFCVAGTEGTVQLEPVGIVKKGSTQGKQHFLGFKKTNKPTLEKKKAHESQLVIFPSARSPEVSI